MPFSIKTFVQNICLFTFLLLATLVVDGKEKLASPHKSSEGKSSVPTLHVPWVYRNHPMLSRPALPLSLDPIRFTLHASKQTIAAGEEVEITITAQLLDIPSSAFFIFEDQKSFSLKLLLPQGFTQTGGDYQEFIGGKLSTPNSIFTKRIRGVFASVPENPCFVLLRGAYNANSSSVFEQKQVLCLASKNTTQATRVANCVSPVLSSITPQTICYGGAFYMVNTSVTNGVEVYYQWYNDNGSANNNTNSIAGENRANLRSFPTEPGIYKYKVVATSSENSACTASQSVTLTINAPPTITSTTGTNPNCAPSYGGTIAVTGAGGTTFVYSKDNGGNWVDLTGNNSQNEITRNTMLQSLQKDVAKVKITLEEGFGLLPGGEYIGEIRNESSPPTFEGLAAGTYAIRVKNENGCVSAPTAVTLTNPNAPAIFNVTGGGACFTNGAPIQLSGSVTGINYYLLRNEVAVTGAIAGTGGVLSFGNYATEGTYTVLATNATTGCSAQMANTAVVSSGIPSAPTVDNEPTTVCAGQQVVLTTQSSCAGTLVWSPSGGTLSNDNKNYTVSPSANTSYSVKCQVNDCVSEASNSVAVTVTTLAAPSIAGESTRTLCPDTPVTLVASGCPSAVSWSYSLSSGAAGTLAATGSTLELTFTNSGIAAWNTGDVLSVRATCTSLTCSSQPSEAVEITKQASCTISTALADCAFYIKAADAQGTETTKLTRTGAGGSIFQLLTLSAQTLEGTSPTGVTYSWTGPGITTPLTTAQISATQVGEYKLVLTPPSGGGGLGVCELYITLSGTPCTIPTSAACGIPANITPSRQGGPYLTSLAPGDQFTANDYVITVTSVINSPLQQGEGQGVRFSGEGYARMKLTNGFSIDVPVVFGQANGSGTTTTVTPIKLNTCYQLVEGTVVTQYDPSWGNVVDVDETFGALKEILTELEDIYQSYSGTQEEKDKIRQRNADICSQIENNTTLSAAEKSTLAQQCSDYQQKSESFLNCLTPDLTKESTIPQPFSTPNTRISASYTESCKLSDMINQTNQFNSLITLANAPQNGNVSTIVPEQEVLQNSTLTTQTNFLVPSSATENPVVFSLPPNSSIVYPFIADVDKNEGALMAFKTADSKVIIADTRSSSGFAGYSEIAQGAWGGKFVPTPITERPVQFLHVKYFSVAEGCKVEGYRAVLKADHSMNITAEKVLDLVVEASKCSNQLEIYANTLKTWLDNSSINADVYLADCANSKYYHITRNAATLQTGAAPSLANSTSFTADFAIKACWDGQKWTQIEHKFKPGALNPTHPKLQGQTAQIELLSNQRIETKLKNEYPNKTSTGKATKRGTVDADGFRFDQLDIFEMIITVKNVTKELCNNAKVPEQLYDPANNGFTPSPVNVPAFAAGAGDGVLEELTGGLQFISFGLDLATEPAKAKQMYAKIKSVKLTDLVKIAQNSLSDRINIYNQGGIKAQHQGGKDAFTIAQLFFGPYRAMSKADDLVGATAENAVDRTAKTLDDLPQMRELDYFSEKSKRGILKDIEDPEVKAFILQNPDVIRGFYKYKTEWNNLTELEKANMEEAYRKLDAMANSGEVSSSAYNKIEGWYKRSEKIDSDPEYQVVRSKIRSIAHEKKVTEMYGNLLENGVKKYSRVLQQRYVKFSYGGKDYESVVDNILVENTPSGLKYSWSDAKLGEGDFTSIQKKLMLHIEAGGTVTLKKAEDGLDRSFTFSEMYEVRSNSENISGIPELLWSN